MREPKTKQDLLNTILQRDFNGDLTTLSPEGVQLKRIAPNQLAMTFPVSGSRFVLCVRKPRPDKPAKKARGKPNAAMADLPEEEEERSTPPPRQAPRKQPPRVIGQRARH